MEKATFNCFNLHFTDVCNYHCKHCFVKKEGKELSKDELKIIVDKIYLYFNKHHILDGRINLAGGEPLLSKNIDWLIDYIYSKNMKVSIITNGYYLNDIFINRHKKQLNLIGISVDSLIDQTNYQIGRCENNKTLSEEELINISLSIKNSGIKLKINTCVSKLNVRENFNDFIQKIKPNRYKILQMICKDDSPLKELIVSEKEMEEFTKRINYPFILEDKDELKDSYLIIDSKGNLSTNNQHVSTYSILNNNID